MEEAPRKRVAFHTMGCKVNQYDTQAMLEQFLSRGYTVVDFDQDADVYVINTCTVTNLGDRKSRQMIRRAHRKNPDSVVAVVGCYAQRAPEEVMTIPGVKLVLGTNQRHRIVDLVERVQCNGDVINGVEDIMKVNEFEEMPIKAYQGKTRAVLKIQEGCSQFCAYCIIPYARGPVRSRNPQEVHKEVERLVAAGFKEIVLTGIHVASYGRDLEGTDLLSLILQLHSIHGLKRIRLGSLEPTLLTADFLDVVKTLPKVCRHYHISLQSGSDATLKRMNRRYNTAEYRQIIQNLRQRFPDVSVTTDIMVGFPGETDQEFNETLQFVREIAFSKIHVFQYSPREGTPAASFKDQVPPEIKEYRSRDLISLGHQLERNYMERFIGKTEEVLFEEESNLQGAYEGYTDHYIKVAVPAARSVQGEIHKVLLKKVEDNYMLGALEEAFTGDR